MPSNPGGLREAEPPVGPDRAALSLRLVTTPSPRPTRLYSRALTTIGTNPSHSIIACP
jgi:hypothetical protein